MNPNEQQEINELFTNLCIDLDRIVNHYSKEFAEESIIQYIIYQLTMKLLELEHSSKAVKTLFNESIQMGISTIKEIKESEKENL